jgi:glycosyltransferase involved in cell wall biosynthesis
MVKLGIVAFANNSGLGNQTRRLVKMLDPAKILVVDSSPFSINSVQHFDWYNAYECLFTYGMPKQEEIRKFFRGLTHILCCENPLNFFLFSGAKERGIKTFVQSNYEFCDNLAREELPLPTKFLMPSYWKVEEMQAKFGLKKVIYLPPPIDPEEFKPAREVNMNRTGKVELLHIVGTLAAHDRNGTHDILDALKFCKEDFSLTIKSQRQLPGEYTTNVDSRVKFIDGDERDVVNLYKGFDALVVPRRYGGLCLSMNEALMSGMPVIMSAISPNNKALPPEWLVECTKTGQFMARVPIDIYTSNTQKLAEKLDWLVQNINPQMKLQALNIALDNYASYKLKEQYTALWEQNPYGYQRN